MSRWWQWTVKGNVGELASTTLRELPKMLWSAGEAEHGHQRMRRWWHILSSQESLCWQRWLREALEQLGEQVNQVQPAAAAWSGDRRNDPYITDLVPPGNQGLNEKIRNWLSSWANIKLFRLGSCKVIWECCDSLCAVSEDDLMYLSIVIFDWVACKRSISLYLCTSVIKKWN